MKIFSVSSSKLALLALFVTWIALPHASATPETWANTGAMNVARISHTATLLPNGKVLVVGGSSSNGSGVFLSSAELYDPVTGSWNITGSMQTARGWHTATLLANGKVLVVGGFDSGNNRVSSAEVYDPATGNWTNTGSMNAAREQHRATLLATGKVLVAGGTSNGNYLSSSEVYDPMTGEWASVGSMNSARTNHTATLLLSGKVLVAGGTSNGSNKLPTAELYDPASGTWTPTALMATGRGWHTATLLANGKVLVTGGHDGITGTISTSEIYDPATGGWINAGPMNSKRWFHRSIHLASGKVLIAGGGEPNLVKVELFNPSTGNWTGTGAMTVERDSFEVTLLANGKVLAAGGEGNGGGIIPNVELYDPGVTLNLEDTFHGTITGNSSPYSVNASATISAAPNPGYVFTSWTGDATGIANPLSVQMDSDKTIGANFAQDGADPDGDGLTNYREIVELGTNPTLRNTDGDSADDGDDDFPLDPAETRDTDGDGVGDNADSDDDGDGLPDADELAIHGTNPKRADSDGDGLSDKDEIEVHFTNPMDSDWDDDGLSDGAEFLVYHTGFKDPDSDDDGFLDGYEILTGKLPLDPLSKPALVAEAHTAIEFTFPSALGKSYRIEGSTDLLDWSVVEGGIAGTGGEIKRFYSIKGQPKRYFRVEENSAQ